KPGEMLTEQYLADIYQTSKTPVREGLMRLSAEHFITVLPHKGYMITDIPYADLYERFQFRGILECACIEYAAKYATEQQLDHLETLAGNLRAFYEDKPHFSYSAFSNSDFHIYLAQIAGNHFLMETLVKVVEQLQRFLWASTTESLKESGISQHYQIIKLIREKQVTKAQLLMKKHINDTFEAGMERKIRGIF
ncbi:MAG: GntR family transcriptional regulator, partial [Clostridiales bacterium]